MTNFYAYAPKNKEAIHYTNTIDGLELAYQKGFRLVEVDLEKTSDGQLVCAHEWATQRFVYDIEQSVTPHSASYATQIESSHFHHHCNIDSLLKWISSKPDVKVIFDIKDYGVFNQVIALPDDSWLKQSLYSLAQNVKHNIHEEGSSYYALSYAYNYALETAEVGAKKLLGINENQRAERQLDIIREIAAKIQHEDIPNVLHQIVPSTFACNAYKDGISHFHHIENLGFQKVQCDFMENAYSFNYIPNIYAWLKTLTPKSQEKVIITFHTSSLTTPTFTYFLEQIDKEFNVITLSCGTDPSLNKDEFAKLLALHEKHHVDYMAGPFPDTLHDKFYQKVPLEMKLLPNPENDGKSESISFVNLSSNHTIDMTDWYIKGRAMNWEYKFAAAKLQPQEQTDNIFHHAQGFTYDPNIIITKNFMESYYPVSASKPTAENFIADIVHSNLSNYMDTVTLYDKTHDKIMSCSFNNAVIGNEVSCTSYGYIHTDFILG